MAKYIELKDLEVYQISRELSSVCWAIYSAMGYEQKKIIGDQFIRSVDSVGANIAEGYGRFHSLDQVKFYLTARASLFEAQYHWTELLFEREMIKDEAFEQIKSLSKKLEIKLNNFIKVTRNQLSK
ncbi:MAG: four helix bundle protein [Bacteroidota bacterium]